VTVYGALYDIFGELSLPRNRSKPKQCLSQNILSNDHSGSIYRARYNKIIIMFKKMDLDMSEIKKTDQEWQKILSPLAYKVTRKHGTERAFSHDNFPKQAGYFTCVCCGAHLFSQADKFDSGTGWPSFTKAAQGTKVGESEDNSWFTTRTEVHCQVCAAHLGHVFPDGPAPTGLRYCMNGVAMNFNPEGND
jgi:peptide-methionine (R)-S-oxide reductase